MYDPSVGRFITEDPSEFVGGDVNLYRYVGNDPTNKTDPSGMQYAGPVYPAPVIPKVPPPPTPPQPPNQPGHWWDPIIDFIGAICGYGVPEPTGSTVGGLDCVGEMCQPDNIENAAKRNMDFYKAGGCKEDFEYWRKIYENCKKMREDAKKK